MGALKRAGLITVARGTGGAELAHPPPQGNHSGRVLVIVATPDLPQGGSGDQKPPKRRPWRGTPL
ncbi:MAG: hypothetical protein E7I22_06885, partial [Bifidobacterium longum]|nr:hypothetical protein [Bifidobacterium longum]